MEENVLIRALRNGDETAFEELYHRYWYKVLRFARLYISDSHNANDIVQDVFLRLWSNRTKVDVEKNIEGYLFIITRNLIFSQSKKKHFNYHTYLKTIEDAIQDAYSIENHLEAKELSAMIDTIIDQMPAKRRAVFILSRREHKSYKEIAQLLDISEKTVERHINEALKTIRSSLYLFFIFLFFGGNNNI